MSFIYQFLGWVMDGCYSLFKNYGLAIIAFTFLSKIILIPVSIWVQKNSIKMVKMQPEINIIKAKHYGDKDTIAELQANLYKREKYNAFASVIPMAIQILLLLALIHVIRVGMENPVIDKLFLGISLDEIPVNEGGILYLVPFVAGAAAWLLCVVQNRANVLQANSSVFEKYFTMVISVGLSLYLGFFVQVGVILYWIFSNLFGIVQIFILNAAINPQKYIDFEKLEESRKELSALENIGKKSEISKEDKKREKADYKRFFSIENKHLVFYSESSGFYKYFKGVIEYILDNTNMVIHYITSDPKDAVFELSKKRTQLKPYYIGEKRLITLMMRMEADIVVMTMPDLENYHIKRSYIKKDIQYIFIPHSMCSLNLTMRTASIDHFDTIFCTGKHQREETEKTEIAYGLPKKKLIDWGYCLLDSMRADYEDKPITEDNPKTILIAPSWQKDNIVDSCLDELLEALRGHGYQIIVRPHPQHVRLQPERMDGLKTKFANDKDIEIQTDFSSNTTVFDADVMITDWSGIAYEYSFTTYKPVIFIDTPLKIMNPEYKRIDTEPFNIWIRNVLGRVIKPEQAGEVYDVVRDLMEHAGDYRENIKKHAYEYVYNLDHSSEVGGKYIISEVQRIIKEKKEKEK